MTGIDTLRALWLTDGFPEVIDQKWLPFKYETVKLLSCRQAGEAILDMTVRGAPLIGITAAYAMALSAKEACNEASPLQKLTEDYKWLINVRPTAVNLALGASAVFEVVKDVSDTSTWTDIAFSAAASFYEKEVECCRSIGEHGKLLIDKIHSSKGSVVNVLTHCNAGWLACGGYGTALAPVYLAHQAGVPVHVWVDETRPRNQGARLTAWELQQAGIPFTVIPDNTGGHLMQQGLVDICFVGSDRCAMNGDVANKIGTYLKALAAFDNQVPFYVALPMTTFDRNLETGVGTIPIEQRPADEVNRMFVKSGTDTNLEAELFPLTFPVANYGFDVTPARLITGLITENGICKPCKEGILGLFPQLKK